LPTTSRGFAAHQAISSQRHSPTRKPQKARTGTLVGKITTMTPIVRIVAWEIVAALILQTAADCLGVSSVKRLGKAWAASAARRLQFLSQPRAE
jgi:hypothetical protein